jgi:hypothetical protein
MPANQNPRPSTRIAAFRRQNVLQRPPLILTWKAAGIDRVVFLRRWADNVRTQSQRQPRTLRVRFRSGNNDSTTVQPKDQQTSTASMARELRLETIEEEDHGLSSELPTTQNADTTAAKPETICSPVGPSSPHSGPVRSIEEDLLKGMMPPNRAPNVYEEVWEPGKFEIGSPAQKLSSTLADLCKHVNTNDMPTWEQLVDAEDIVDFLHDWMRHLKVNGRHSI